MIADLVLQGIIVVTSLGAAVFWAISASVHIPDLLHTPLSGDGSISDILREQSKLNAVGARFAAISVFFQGALYLL